MLNMEAMAQICIGAGVTAAFHPLSYVKTLIQLSYEPLPASPARSIFGRRVLAYPGLFKYLSIIRKEDGFFGMYRGLGARLTGGIMGSLTTNAVSLNLKGEVGKSQKSEKDTSSEIDGDEDNAVDQMVIFLKDTCIETVSRCSGVIVAHPFHVIMVRQMAQFVGKEVEYRNIFTSISEVYEKNGILGFFSGLVPRLMGEIITIWLSSLLAHLLNTYVLPKSEGASYMKNYTNAASSLMVTQVTYPFMLVSNIMAVNNSGLSAGRPPVSVIHASWTSCWRHLSRENALKRGSSVFFRYYKGPVTFLHDGTMAPSMY